MSEPQEDWFEAQLRDEIARFDDNATAQRRYARRYMWLSAIFSTVTTILLGLQGLPEPIVPWTKNIALVLSASLSIFSAVNAIYGHRQLWIQYTMSWAQMRLILKDLQFISAYEPEKRLSRIDELYKHFREVLSETDTAWSRLRQDTKSGAKGG